jgi:hypothetical protein
MLEGPLRRGIPKPSRDTAAAILQLTLWRPSRRPGFKMLSFNKSSLARPNAVRRSLIQSFSSPVGWGELFDFPPEDCCRLNHMQVPKNPQYPSNPTETECIVLVSPYTSNERYVC